MYLFDLFYVNTTICTYVLQPREQSPLNPSSPRSRMDPSVSDFISGGPSTMAGTAIEELGTSNG